MAPLSFWQYAIDGTLLNRQTMSTRASPKRFRKLAIPLVRQSLQWACIIARLATLGAKGAEVAPLYQVAIKGPNRLPQSTGKVIQWFLVSFIDMPVGSTAEEESVSTYTDWRSTWPGVTTVRLADRATDSMLASTSRSSLMIPWNPHVVKWGQSSPPISVFALISTPLSCNHLT